MIPAEKGQGVSMNPGGHSDRWARVALALLIGTFSVPVGTGHAQERALTQADPSSEPWLALVDMPLVSALSQRDAAPGTTATPLRAAPRIAWNRVTVFCPRKITTAELKDNIACLFRYQWQAQKDKNDRDIAVLDSTAPQRYFEQRLWESTLDRAIKPATDFARYARKPVSYWSKEKKTSGSTKSGDPFLSSYNLDILSTDYHHAGLEFLGTIGRNQLRTLADTGILVLPWITTTPQQQSLVLASCVRAASDRYGRDEYPLSAEQALAVNRQEQKWVRNFGVMLVAGKDAVTGAVRGVSIARGSTPTGLGEVPTTGFRRSLLPVRGSLYLTLPSTKTDPAATEPPLPTYDDLAALPFPKALAQLAKAGAPWPKILEQLSQSTEQPVLSDSFSAARYLRMPSRDKAPVLGDLSLVDGLDKLCEANGYLWWRENGALLFRSRTWFIEQQYEVPPPILERLAAQTSGGTQLTTQALDTLATLSQHQMEGLAALSAVQINRNRTSGDAASPRSIPATFGGDALYFAWILQIWTQLSPTQKLAVLSKEGLPAADLSDSQKADYLSLVTLNSGSQALSDLPKMRLRMQAFPQPRPDSKKATQPAQGQPAPEWNTMTLFLSLEGKSGKLFPIAVPATPATTATTQK